MTRDYFFLGCRWLAFGWIVGTLGSGGLAVGEDYEQDPIRYAEQAPQNRVSRLVADLEQGRKTLTYEPHFGYLRGLLAALEVPESSQVLVFSKTSLQRHRISPKTPRALYFNDDIYVGFCQHGDVLELSVVDDELGAVFYTLNQTPVDRPSEDGAAGSQVLAPPKIMRQLDNCLICHGSSATKGVPGHLVRSVFADASGQPILSSGSFRIDHTSPLKQRWGGWYVTGRHGAQAHLGNLVSQADSTPNDVDNSAGQNITDLGTRIRTSGYLTPHSDLVALMILEHQATAHNLITKANFETRQALHHEQLLNRELGKPAGDRWESTNSRIRSANEGLVQYLLFCDEARLSSPLSGTSDYAREFSNGPGPRDGRGRSLRELDLNRRLFKYPCSYLIYSSAFASLPDESRQFVLRRLTDVLTGRDTSPKFSHLTDEDRSVLHEILTETVPGYPLAAS